MKPVVGIGSARRHPAASRTSVYPPVPSRGSARSYLRVRRAACGQIDERDGAVVTSQPPVWVVSTFVV